MSPALRGAIALALLGLTAGAPSASAQSANYSTNIINPFYTTVASFTTTTSTSSPTFNRPGLANVPGVTAPPTALSGGGTAVGYAAQSFTPTASGLYQVTTTVNSGYSTAAASASGTDNFVQAVYGPGSSGSGFNPSSPLTNALLAYSQGTSGDSYSNPISLSGGSGYTFVNTGYYNSNLTGSKLSIGSATTSIALYNAGSTMNIPQATTLKASAPISQTLTLYGGGAVTSFNSITIAGLQDDYAGSLEATLTHDGTTVTLFNQPDSSGLGAADSFDPSQTYKFADSGANLAATMEAVNSSGNPLGPFPLPGNTFQSQGQLAAFDGDPLAGAWTLSLLHGSNGSTVSSFLGFTFNASSPAAVPEASTWVGFGMGCLALTLLAVKRRRDAVLAPGAA